MTQSKPIVYEDIYYTSAQTCKILGLSADDIAALTKDKSIRGVEFIKNVHLYRGIDILRFWTSRTHSHD